MSEENASVDVQEEPSIETNEQVEAPAEVQKAIEKMEREYSFKANGKEQKARIDLNDEQRIIKALSMEAAAQEAMQERAALRKQQEEMQSNLADFINELKSNPLAVLQHQELGVDVKQLVEAYLQNEVERSQKSPEQLELEQARAQLEKLQEEKKLAEEAREELKNHQIEQEMRLELEKEVSHAIEIGDLPKSRYISQKLIDLAHIAAANGIDVSIAELAPLVKKQYLKDMKEMLGISNDEIVEDLLGKDRIKAMRNKQIQSVKQSIAPALKTQDVGSSDKKETAPQRLKASDFFKKIGG